MSEKSDAAAEKKADAAQAKQDAKDAKTAKPALKILSTDEAREQIQKKQVAAIAKSNDDAQKLKA